MRVTLDTYLNPQVAGASLPYATILEEKPVHRNVAYLMVAGRTRKEISELTGLSVVYLSQLARQPWFQVRVKAIADAAGKDMVKAYLEGEVIPSLEVLRTIRDNPAEKGATRVTASTARLDRFLGKPIAHIESTATLNIHTAGRAAETVESELSKIDAELRARGVKLATNGAS